MRSSSTGFHTEIFPATRLGTVDVCEVGRKRHHMVALAELDVTEGRRKIRALRRSSGSPVSFTAWIVSCVGRAAADYPMAHAMYARGRRIAVFDTVDITVLVERVVDGERVPLPYVVRGVERKSAIEVSEEMRRAAEETLAPGQTVIGDPGSARDAGFYGRLPGFLRRAFWRKLSRDPRRAGPTMGTISVTSIGGYGRLGAWVIPISIFPLTVALGSVARKPVATADGIVPRDVLHATLLLDHDVIDGLPASRFAARLARLVESAWGLEPGV